MTRYGAKFKEEALKLSDEIGPAKAAGNLGINYSTMALWRSERKKKQEAYAKKFKSTEEAIKYQEKLEKEIAEQKRTIEILKEAMGFFVGSQKK